MDAEKERPEGTAIPTGLFEATGDETSERIMHENDGADFGRLFLENAQIEEDFISRVGELIREAGGVDEEAVLARTLGIIRKRLFPAISGANESGSFVHSGVAMYPGSLGVLALYLGEVDEGQCAAGFIPVDSEALAKAADPNYSLDIEVASDGLLGELESMGDGRWMRSPDAVVLAACLANAIRPISADSLARRGDFASCAIWVVGRPSDEGRKVASGFARLERRPTEAVYRAVHGAAEAA